MARGPWARRWTGPWCRPPGVRRRPGSRSRTEGRSDVEPTASEALYGAGPETALDLVRETPDDVRRLVVVGHNPTMAYLAPLLDDGEGDDGGREQMAAGFPTGALAVFEVRGAWADLDAAVRPPRRPSTSVAADGPTWVRAAARA